MFSVRNVGLVSSFKRNSLDIAFESTPLNVSSNCRNLKYLFIYNTHHIFRGKKYPKRCITLLIRLLIIFSVENRLLDECLHQKFQERYETRPVASTYARTMNVTTTQRWGYNNDDVTVNDVGQLKRASLQSVGKNESSI